MNWLKQHSVKLLGFGSLLILAYLSIQVRKENLAAPLGRHHEWITAHTLITTTIWEQGGGPSAYHFSPVYSYTGKGSHYRNALGGVVDAKGDVYYVSYPPFSFLFYYYTSQLLGGTSVFSIRVIAVFIHIISALLLFLLIKALNANDNRFNLGGIIAAGFYLLSAGNLWYHGNLYFADMLVQPLIFLALLMVLKIKQRTFKNERVILTLLFAILFLATYTEWLGLFTAFFIGVVFLVMAIMQKKRLYYYVFFIAALASTSSLCLTVYQFSSIAGWSELKAISLNKYAERSGYNNEIGSAAEFNINDGESLGRITNGIASDYKYLLQFLLVAAILMVVVLTVNHFKKGQSKKESIQLKPTFFCISLIALPILLHYILFFNFNSVHDFSAIKTAGLICIVTGIISQTIHNLSIKQNTIYGVLTALSLLVFMTIKLNNSTALYAVKNPISELDMDRLASAEIIKTTAPKDIAVFTNVDLTPEQIYYANHMLTPISDDYPKPLEVMKVTMQMFSNTKAKFYRHSGSKLNAIIDIQLQGDNLVFLDTLILNN